MHDSTSDSSSSSEDEPVLYIRKRKVYRKREDPIQKYCEKEFFDRFRLTKNTVNALLEMIINNIELPSNRGGCIKPMTQLLLTLRFYATGSMLLSAGDFMGVSKTSACMIVRRVSRAIASLRPRYIKMSVENGEMERTAQEFYEIARFPRVVGAIDCTLIRIQSPGGEDAEIFRCRKGFFALNVQTVSDANLKFTNVVARWPGSCHDQTIFNNSNLKRNFLEGNYGKYLLVGDSGYAIEPYLMTKLQVSHNAAENLYNESIIRTRNVVERQYGVWKRRFPVLSLGIRLNLETTQNIIIATAVLHNIAIEMNEDYPQEWLENVQFEEDNINIENIHGNGFNYRRLLINEHFARM